MPGLEDHLSRQLEHSERFFWNRLRWDLVAEHVPAGEGIEVVDIGAGPGFLGRSLQSRRPGVTYRFIEPIEELEAHLTSRYGGEANFRQRSSFGDAQYAVLLDVLEHQADDRRFMEELSEKMAPGASLLLTVPAMAWLWSGWDEVLGHHRRYDKGSLSQVVSGLPLKTIEMSYIFPELVPAALIRKRTKPSGLPGKDREAEFPDPPRLVNEALYRVGRRSLRLRSRWPIGTSLFAALRRV